MSIIYMHKRGSRAIGSRVPSGLRHIDYNPIVNGEGKFSMPDNTPEATLEFLVKCGHKKLSSTPEKIQKVEQGPSWTDGLSGIKGCGKKTIEFLISEFKTKKELLDYDDSKGPAGTIKPEVWTKIKDYIQK